MSAGSLLHRYVSEIGEEAQSRKDEYPTYMIATAMPRWTWFAAIPLGLLLD
jgi:hypothetical protein